MSAAEGDPVNARELKRAVRELDNADPDVRLEGVKRLQRLINRAASRLCGIRCPESIAEDRILHHAANKIASRPDIAAPLLRALDDPDMKVRSWATMPAWNVKTEAAEDTLIRRMLEDPEPHVRTMCSVALGRFNSPRTHQALSTALRDSEWKVVSAACGGLNGSGYTEAIEPLRETLDHPKWSVRFHACEALISLDAFDEQLISALEKIVLEPGAAEHDEMVRFHDETSVDYMGDEFKQSPTVREVLESARTALAGGK